jgi:hypothetical protein
VKAWQRVRRRVYLALALGLLAAVLAGRCVAESGSHPPPILGE